MTKEERAEAYARMGILHEMKFSTSIERYNENFKSYLKSVLITAYDSNKERKNPIYMQTFISAGSINPGDYFQIVRSSEIKIRFLIFKDLRSKQKFARAPETDIHQSVVDNWEINKESYLSKIKNNVNGH